ncbi:Brl1/Brr6 domain-containing protein [Gilbertella persicaria]|uniref:Brl1/Brr6 domain-containing protein n=1 Tax=Gilbertella persicaria TaxID=101096 RepID=UPI002220C20D|nr:Brl1/Brr6 domain-containing protein [Gilbertella persicaria]KAI8094825.1 Brl1/Brr6 domain-containing protein [Gilbertella persicaria]
MYLIIQLTLLFRHDMKVKITSYESDLLGEQIYCQQQYGLNRCGPETRLPAVNHLCREWEQCMHRPIAVSKSQILAETLADMANAFSDGLTLKTMSEYHLVCCLCTSRKPNYRYHSYSIKT